MFDLTGKTALVTGATGGIGGAIARALHAQGATVAISGTRREALDTLAAELGERVHVLPCDLADKDAVEALVPAAEEGDGQARHPGRQCRHHQGQSVRRSCKDEDWDQVIAVNLTATFRLARAAVEGMMRRRFGRIIGITSVVGVTGNPGQGNYTASKAGMIGMIKSIGSRIRQARRHRQLHRAGHSSPPPMTDKLNDKQREAILAQVPAGRLGSRRRCRGGGGLSCLRRGRLCHRPDPACQRRHGDDLTAGNAGICRATAGCRCWSSAFEVC